MERNVRLKNVSESLAGRAAILSLYPMSLGELHESPSAWIVNFLNKPLDFVNKSNNRIILKNN